MPTTAEPDAGAGVADHPAPARWVFGSTAQRRAAVAAAVLALLSVVITVNGARARPGHRIRTVAVPAPPAAATVDATGCPRTAECLVVQRATGLDAVFARAFPNGQVVNVQATLDLRDNRTYRSSLLGLVSVAGGSATVELAAQCVPGAPRSRARLDHSATAHVDLAGNGLIESRQLSVLVPGRPGCAVALLLSSAGAASPFDTAALRLVHDPAAQLHP